MITVTTETIFSMVIYESTEYHLIIMQFNL